MCRMLRTPSRTNVQGMHVHYTGMSLLGSSRHQVTLSCRDVPGLSCDVLCKNLQTPSHTSHLQGCTGLFWDVPLGILRTPSTSHTNLQGCTDCPGMSLVRYTPDTKLHQSSGMCRNVLHGMSLGGFLQKTIHTNI